MESSRATKAVIIYVPKLPVIWLGSQTRWRICIHQNNKSSFHDNLRRSIISTPPRPLFKIPKTTSTSKSPTDIFSIGDSQSKGPDGDFGKSNPTSNSWINPTIKKMDSTNQDIFSNTISSWTSPIGEKPFPFSRHPSRNSLTTPKDTVSLSPASDAVIQKALTNKIYGKDIDWYKMIDTDSSSSKLMELANTLKTKPFRQLLSFSPSSGRSVFVTPKVDIMMAFKKMEMGCSRNRVRREATAQRFHERPGLKRKRLKSLKWRERFLDSFKATLNRVQDLRSQGW